ncbi:MAG: MATE family efflux transporter [Eubacteriales bacterium]|nr:MATE family efflux transporter [Eubacteriales bacterium]
MGVMPCNRLILTMSVPIMISMLVQALYNIVDSIFVAMLNENALTAVSLAFPVQSLMIAIMVGTGVGINARLSKKLGEGDGENVNRTAGNAIFLTFCNMLFFMLLGILFTELFFRTQTEDAQIIEYGIQYLSVVTFLCGGFAFQVTFERLVQATGRTLYSMISQGVGAVINIILDPIMIFGLFGFPKLGVTGAALATVIGQWVAAGVGLYLNLNKNPEICFAPRYLKPAGRIIADIYAVGIPSIIMQSIASVMTFGMNKILIVFSSTATAVFGVYFKLQSFVFMPIFGLNNGIVPMIAYNYGARKPERMRRIFKLGNFYSFVIMAVGTILFNIGADWLLTLFSASDQMLEIGVPALRTISLAFVLAGFNIICSSMFQALGHGMLSLCVSVIRQLVILLPAAFLFAKWKGLFAVWWAFPLAEIVAFLLSILFIRHIFRAEIEPLEPEKAA